MQIQAIAFPVDATRENLFWLMRGKRIIRTVLDKYTDVVTDDHAKMICRAPAQSVDVRRDVLVCVPAVSLE
jgi:hypothetical protein